MTSNSQRDLKEAATLRGVGLRIARRRLALGWTRRQLAQRLDMRPSELGRYENGTAQPTVTVLRRIGRILGVPAEVLLNDVVEPAPAAAPERRGRTRRERVERAVEPIGRAERFAARLAAWMSRDAGDGDDGLSPDAYDQVFHRVESRVAEVYERCEREDARAWELLGVTDEERRALLASQSDRFANTGVALRLVREAEARVEGDAGRADRFAKDALAILRRLEKEPARAEHPRVLHGEIEVRAWCSLAQTARRRGELDVAESHLECAAARLDEVGVDVRALYCRALGLTRADRGRTDEALALLARAADLLRQVGEERERGEVLERAGWLSLRDLAEPLPALDLLQTASAAFRKAEAPAAAGAVQVVIAWALHQAGLPEWVLQALDLARAQVATRPPGDPERVRLEWLAAWLEANLGAAAPALSVSSRGPLSVALPFERELPGSPRGH